MKKRLRKIEWIVVPGGYQGLKSENGRKIKQIWIEKKRDKIGIEIETGVRYLSVAWIESKGGRIEVNEAMGGRKKRLQSHIVSFFRERKFRERKRKEKEWRTILYYTKFYFVCRVRVISTPLSLLCVRAYELFIYLFILHRYVMLVYGDYRRGLMRRVDYTL